MYVSKKVEESFKHRLDEGIELIKNSKINYIEIGVFGSYARKEYKANSDIDICIIVNEHPNRTDSGLLRMKAEELKIDIIYSTPTYFSSADTLFAKNLRKDYIKII